MRKGIIVGVFATLLSVIAFFVWAANISFEADQDIFTTIMADNIMATEYTCDMVVRDTIERYVGEYDEIRCFNTPAMFFGNQIITSTWNQTYIEMSRSDWYVPTYNRAWQQLSGDDAGVWYREYEFSMEVDYFVFVSSPAVIVAYRH